MTAALKARLHRCSEHGCWRKSRPVAAMPGMWWMRCPQHGVEARRAFLGASSGGVKTPEAPGV